MPSERIVLRTGGQSGVDRASLDLARQLGLEYEGWCPQGGWAEDLEEPPGLLALYHNLNETLPGDPLVQDVIRRHPDLQGLPLSDPAVRTVMNVEDSNALLTLTRQEAYSGGANLAVDTARAMGMPEITVFLDDPEQAAVELRRFLSSLPPGTVLDLNGPRESQAPGIYQQVLDLLGAALKELEELPHSYLDSLDLDLVTHFGGEDEPLYLTGVYFPDDFEREFCFEQRGGENLDETLRNHQAMLTDWSEPIRGICVTCEEPGWIIEEKQYCRSAAEHEPVVCAECEPDYPCETHGGGQEE